MKKPLITILIIIVVVLATLSITGNTLVVVSAKNKPSTMNGLKPGDVIDPFAQLRRKHGRLAVYLHIANSDKQGLAKGIKKASCLTTSDTSVINRMMNSWKFKYSGGDMATVESSIYIFDDGKLVFSSAIVLEDEPEGLQDATFGWVEPTDAKVMVNICRKFKKVNWPIVIL